MQKKEFIEIPQGSHEFEFEKYKTLLADRTAHVQAHLTSLTAYANNAIRGLFLLNGAVGLAAFLRDGTQRQSLEACAWGAVAAVCASIFAYLSQRTYMSADLKTCDQDIERLFGLKISKRTVGQKYWPAATFLVFACLSVGASLLFFCKAILR